MKKIICFVSVFVLFMFNIFAGGGSYYDDNFPDFSYVMTSIQYEFIDKKEKQTFYVFDDCDAIISSGKLIHLSAGTSVEIISMEKELKFCHDFDTFGGVGENKGIIYYDYLCNFIVNGKKYTGKVPGIYITNAKSVIDDKGIVFRYMEKWVIPSSLFYRDLKDCDSFEQVNTKIQNIITSDWISEVMWLNQKSRKLISRRLYNCSSKKMIDIVTYFDKNLDFMPQGQGAISFEKNLPKGVFVLEYSNYNGGMGGGNFQKTWLALNPLNGRTYMICQCSYTDSEVWYGNAKIVFDNRGAVLHVEEINEMGEQIQNTTKILKQNSESPYIFDNNSSLFNISQDKAFDYQIYYAKENLKLRESQDLVSDTKVIMAKRTSVSVLEIGKEETIEGITSNWVLVEVKYGKDKNGNKIPSFTKGWCFGGYLSFY